MSTTVKVASVQQRSTEATKRLQDIFDAHDLKLLRIAVEEAVADEAGRNPLFAKRVREAYKELVELKPHRATRGSNKFEDVKLVPIIQVEGLKFDPHASLDPYFLLRVYGAQQLRAALTGNSLARLKEGLAPVEQNNPGTKPRSRALKDSVIDYIVEKVAGPGY